MVQRDARGSFYVVDEPVEQGRMVGIIGSDRSAAVERELISGCLHSGDVPPTPSSPVFRHVLVAAAAAVLVAGCGDGGDRGSATDCDLNGCTVTFQRDGTTLVSVLGVQARLVGVDAGAARIEVAGATVAVPVGGTAEAAGLAVRVERVTDTEVVVRISR